MVTKEERERRAARAAAFKEALLELLEEFDQGVRVLEQRRAKLKGELALAKNATAINYLKMGKRMTEKAMFPWTC